MTRYGAMIRPPDCVAARTSVILDEMMIPASTLSMLAVGITAQSMVHMASSGRNGCGNRAVGRSVSVRMMKITVPAYAAAREGITQAKILPSNNSPSVVGVASNGSNVFSTFSPTMLYDDK